MSQDIQQGWLNVARRLQAASAQQQGAAIISVKIVVSGIQPVFWSEPEVTRLEPKAKAEDIISLLVDNG